MKRTCVLSLAVTMTALAAVADMHAYNGVVREAIVKIYTIQDRADYYNPWSMRGPGSGTGSGCVIEGRKILTNAHVVSDQTFIQVRRYSQTRRYEAKVVSVSHEADLALLTVEDESFFEGVQPLTLGTLPSSQEEVLVYGFPLGGDTLSITKGVVSRIEHQTYAHSSSYFLAGQIDAAINPGNSGGPVVVGDKIVGVVMQSLQKADNIGYMVPVNLIRHFLDDLADGKYDGFASLGVVMQPMENPDLKRKYGVPDGMGGLLVTRVLPGSPADGLIRVGDVVLQVDRYNVEDDGTVEFRPKERTSVHYAVQEHQVGEDLDLEVWRDGAVHRITLTLDRPLQEDLLVPMEAFDTPPSYFIYGGVVFCPLSKDLLKAWGNNWYNTAPKNLAALLTDNLPKEEGEQVVVLLKVLAAGVNQGYHEYKSWIITKVDGEKISNLRDLVNRVESGTGPFVTFEGDKGQQIVLDRAKAQASKNAILRTYRIGSDRSKDLRAPERLGLEPMK